MYCHFCHFQNDESCQRCTQCDTALMKACPQCGHGAALTAKFCSECGKPLTQPASSLDCAAPVGGLTELKQATVLFADIVSSTEQIAELDAEAAMERLRPAVRLMCDVVERYHGTVVRTLGDGILALFGVPLALEGHALLACEAALALQNEFRDGARGFTLRVGLHSGPVASEPDDLGGGRGGGVHGVTIHLASRVIGLAQPGGICITEACRTLVDDACVVHTHGFHDLKGIATPTLIHNLLDLRSHSESERASQRKMQPLRGRADELTLLQDYFKFTQFGDTRVAGIFGDPGGGKSRLCQEFVQWCRQQQVTVCEIRAQIYGHATPLQPVFKLLRRFFLGIKTHHTEEQIRQRIAEQLAHLPAQQETDHALLSDFLGLSHHHAQLATISPQARRKRLLTLVREMVQKGYVQATVILIEDLHWLDEASEAFVQTLVQAVAGTRIFVLLNYRPTYSASWMQESHFHPIELPLLKTPDMVELVQGLVGDVHRADDICALVVRRSAGNPFFAEEIVRTLTERGHLQINRECTEDDIAAMAQALPQTLEAIIGARIDRLGEPEKTLLQMCAIIGKEIPLGILTRVAHPLVQVLEIGLQKLQQADLILPVPRSEGQEGKHDLTFRHPLIQEVAYNAQMRGRRGAIHASVAVAMELYYAGQLDEYAGLIAYHCEAAGQLFKAATYAARSARWVGATDSSQAYKRWRKVHSLLTGLPPSTESNALRALAGGRIVYLGWREGLHLDEVQTIVQEALALASQANHRLIQLLHFAHGRMKQSSGGAADGYVDSICMALALGKDTLNGTSDTGRVATLNLALSHAYAWAGLLHKGLTANDLALQGLSQIDQFDRDFIGFSVEHWAVSIRLRILNRMGRFEEAEQCLRQMPIDAQTAGDPLIHQIAHFAHVDYAWSKGDPALAQHHATIMTSIADEQSSGYAQIFAMFGNGLALMTLHQFEEAQTPLMHALNLMRSTGVAMDFEAEVMAGLAECHLFSGNLAAARSFALETLAIAVQRSNRISKCRALIVSGCCLVATDTASESEEATTLFDRAEKLIALTGAKVLEPALARARLSLHHTGSSQGTWPWLH